MEGDGKWKGLTWEEFVPPLAGLLAFGLDVLARGWRDPYALVVGLLGVVAAYMGRLGWNINKLIAAIATRETKLVKYQGRGAHVQYDQAKRLLDKHCTQVFLMQRSSTLILGPEAQGEAEQEFHKTLMTRIKEKDTIFYPVVSLEGVEKHLAREGDEFFDTGTAFRELKQHAVGHEKRIYIPGENKKHYLKRIDDLIKSDKQARVLVVSLEEGMADALLVLDFGGNQSYLHLRGPLMEEFLKDCLKFYRDECKYLTVKDLGDAVPSLKDRADKIPSS